MTVQVIKSYISSEDAKKIVSGLEKRFMPEPRPGMFSALGQKNSLQASKVSVTNPAAYLGDNEEENNAILFVSQIVNDIKLNMQEFYNIELDLVNMNVSRIETGGGNGLHSDSTKNDGSPWRDDGIPEEIEYSALLYLSEHGEDFTGGEILFPQHDLEILPERGMLVFFKGDHYHLHQVNVVTSGQRNTVVLFYGKKGNISEESFFTD